MAGQPMRSTTIALLASHPQAVVTTQLVSMTLGQRQTMATAQIEDPGADIYRNLSQR